MSYRRTKGPIYWTTNLLSGWTYKVLWRRRTMEFCNWISVRPLTLVMVLTQLAHNWQFSAANKVCASVSKDVVLGFCWDFQIKLVFRTPKNGLLILSFIFTSTDLYFSIMAFWYILKIVLQYLTKFSNSSNHSLK